MLRSSSSDVSFIHKKVLQISSVMGFALLVGQAQLCFAQDAPPPLAPAVPSQSEVISPAPATVTPPKSETLSSPTASVVPKQPNSVAVLDLGIRQEHQDFFYDEKHSAKSSHKKKKRSGVDTQAADDPNRTSMPDASGVNAIRQAQMGDGDALPSAERTRVASSSDEDAQSESSYSKQFGYKRRVSYNEVKGLMTEIRMALKQAGYTVIQPHGLYAKQMEMGDMPSIKDRLAAGDFGNAQYVLIPNVVDASVRETKEAIQNTSDYARRFEMNLTVEFTMVNTDTQAVLASFNATGSGSDMYLGKAYATFVPDMAMVKRNMLSTFGADAKKKLLEQLPKPGADGVVEPKPGAPSAGSFADGDPKTLKVYQLKESEKEVSKDGSSSEKKKEEIRIYRQ